MFETYFIPIQTAFKIFSVSRLKKFALLKEGIYIGGKQINISCMVLKINAKKTSLCLGIFIGKKPLNYTYISLCNFNFVLKNRSTLISVNGAMKCEIQTKVLKVKKLH